MQNVRVKVRRKSVRFQIHALSGAVLDLAALARKARPFAQEFGVRVTFKRGRVAVPPSRAAAARAAGTIELMEATADGKCLDAERVTRMIGCAVS